MADAGQCGTPRGDAVIRCGQRALSWKDELSPSSEKLRAVGHRVHEILDGCGLPSDSNGAIAWKPTFSRSQSDWSAAAQGWLDDPLRGSGLIFSSLLIDGRVVWGDRSLHTVPSTYRRMRDAHPNALRLQLLDALSGGVRTRSLRDVLSRRGGTFDLKNHAVTPIVNLARWGGLTADVRQQARRPGCRRADRRDQSARCRHTVRRLRDAPAAEDGAPGGADVGGPYAR